MLRRRERFLAPLCWLIVFSLSVFLGLTVHSMFPKLPQFVPWLCGGIILMIGILGIDWIWKALNYMLGSTKITSQHLKSDEQSVADFIDTVFFAYQVSYSDLMAKWPSENNNKLISEAHVLLKDSADRQNNIFDQSKLKQRSQRLLEIRDQLRVH